MKASTILFIKEISGKLPVTLTTHNTTERYTGEILKLAGHTEIEGKEIEDDKEYVVPSIISTENNHQRRMRKAYRKHGKEGLVRYIMRFLTPESREWIRSNVEKFC